MSCWTALPNSVLRDAMLAAWCQPCGCIYMIEIGKCYKLELFFSESQLLNIYWKPLLMAITLVNSALAKGENSDLLITVEHRVWINIDAGDPEHHTGPSIRVRGAY